jgi:hypothetical protein
MLSATYLHVSLVPTCHSRRKRRRVNNMLVVYLRNHVLVNSLEDNIAYMVGLSERRRSHFEERGRVKLNDAEANMLALSKWVHVSLLTVLVLFSVWVGGAARSISPWWLSLWAYIVGGITEAFTLGALALCRQTSTV